MATKYDFHKVIIGRSEALSFVDLEIPSVPAKVDTGAYRSAVHASDISEEDGVLSFTLLGGHPQCDAMSKRISVKSYNIVGIRNSFGQREDRYEVKLKAKLGPKVFFAQFTLADRSQNVYPILLGRKLLSHRFLVDTGRAGVDRAVLRKKYGIKFPMDEEEGRD